MYIVFIAMWIHWQRCIMDVQWAYFKWHCIICLTWISIAWENFGSVLTYRRPFLYVYFEYDYFPLQTKLPTFNLTLFIWHYHINKSSLPNCNNYLTFLWNYLIDIFANDVMYLWNYTWSHCKMISQCKFLKTLHKIQVLLNDDVINRLSPQVDIVFFPLCNPCTSILSCVNC